MNEMLDKAGIAGILEVVEGCLGLCSIREQRIIALDKDVGNLRDTCGRAEITLTGEVKHDAR